MIKHGKAFDLQNSIKGPGFPWAKYPGEYHAFGGYNYLGPSTRIDIRLDENMIPKSGEEPIDNTDRAAMNHDIRYILADKSDDPNTSTDDAKVLESKHEADKIMLAELEKIDPSCFREKIAKWLSSKILSLKVKLGVGLEVTNSKVPILD